MRTGGTVSLAGGFPAPDGAAWRALALRAAGGAGLDGLVSRTDDGIAVEPLYAPPLGNAEADRAPAGGWPLAFEIVQPHRHPDPAEAGRQAREDLENGASGVAVRLDRAIGRGGDRPDGVLAYDRAALGRLLAALPDGAGAVRIEAGEWALDRLADLEALAAERASGTAQDCRILADPLGAALEGAAADPAAALAACLRSLADHPALYLAADGRPWHEAGASEAQEIAATLAAAVLWLRRAEALGVPFEVVLPRLELVFGVDADLFLSLAKLRAARLAFERILEAAGLGGRAGEVRIRAETGSRMLARLDPWVNILRTTVAALAAVAGGADAVSVQPFDRPLGEASPLARRIGRNIPLILREEAGVGRVRDPAAGSWYVAHLTRALAEAAWTRLQAIEAAGGLLETLRAGSLQEEVETVRLARAERVALARDALVGVSAFPTLEEKAPPRVPFDPEPALAAARAALAARPRPAGAAPFRPLRAVRAAEPFERLRARAEAAERRDGERPALLVVGLGRSAELYELFARVENLLAAGGLGTIRSPIGEPGEAAALLQRSGRRLLIACVGKSAAPRAEELVQALRSAGVETVWLAGAAEPWPAEAVPIGGELDLVAFLGELHERLGTPEPPAGEAP